MSLPRSALWALALLASVLPAVASHAGTPGSSVPVGQYNLFLSGTNVAWVNFAQDLGPGLTDTVMLGAAFDSIEVHGGNAMRLWLHTTTAYTPAFDASGHVTGPGTNAVTNLQTICDLAARHRIGLLLCLWSFDMMVTSNGQTVIDRSRLMLTDSASTRAYIDNALTPLVAAVKRHPAIIAWEVFNEAEGMSNEFGWSATTHVAMASIQRFTNLVAGAIHRADSSALVTTGAWALIVQTDENPPAKAADPQEALAAIPESRKQEIERSFTARYGFHEPASAILAKLATQNSNYYRDDRLIQAGGDPLGTLDFYTVHYYDWQGTAISPFHHPCSAWKLTKPLVVAEFWPETTLGIPFTELFRLLYNGGYAGALSWGWYSGGTGHSQSTLQANTLVLTDDLFAAFPDVVDNHPIPGFVYSFSARPALVDSGEPSVLSWKTALGTTATLNGSPVALRDTLVVRPAVTSSYTLLTSGTVFDTALARVSVYPSGKIIFFDASATLTAIGDPVKLRWKAAHSSAVRLNGLPVLRADSLVVHLDTTTTYTLTASGGVSDTARITVQPVPVDQLNRALGKIAWASASSADTSQANPLRIVDGDSVGVWQSYPGDRQWIECDLGENFEVSRVRVLWGPNYATVWNVSFSSNGSSWTLARSILNGQGDTETLDSLAGAGRYIRLALTKRLSSTYGFMIRELEVYGRLSVSSAPERSGVPERYALFQNYPNPFNPSTTIEFALPKQSPVEIKVYNTLGQEVASLVQATLPAGTHRVQFQARNLASGLYFYRISAGSFTTVRKMMLLK